MIVTRACIALLGGLLLTASTASASSSRPATLHSVSPDCRQTRLLDDLTRETGSCVRESASPLRFFGTGPVALLIDQPRVLVVRALSVVYCIHQVPQFHLGARLHGARSPPTL